MPAKKTSTKTVKKFTKQPKVTPKKQNVGFSSAALEYLRFGESYTSLVLGIIVVIIATVFLLSFVHNRQTTRPNSDVMPTVVQSNSFSISPTVVPTKEVSETETPTNPVSQTTNNEPMTMTKGGNPLIIGKSYTVVANDSLWIIAEKVYGNGYNWVDIAKANKLSDPNDIHVGNKLAIPHLLTPTPIATVHTNDDDMSHTVAPSVKTAITYTVVHGDDLWDIAVKVYGDGYQWVKIAKANNLSNPNIIHAGNVIKIPRN